jgi:hypothetical protein
LKYLCLVYSERNELGPKTQQQQDELVDEHLAYDETMRASGYYIDSNALETGQNTITVRMRNGKIALTDGPYIETKELNGYFLIEARDLNEAIQVAAKIPAARMGCIEVRPIRILK